MEEMLETWFISDTHLGHKNIIKYCSRPFNNLYEMDNVLIENWNNDIKSEDTIRHLGDVSFNPSRYINRLNGKITLIYGNHDKRRFNSLYHVVKQMHEMEIGRFKCLLLHHPIDENNRFYEERKLLLDRYDYIICGHVHEKWKVKGKNVNVGVDVWNMKPIHIDELANFLETI